MWSEKFHSRTRWNGKKFGRDWKVELKKSFKLYRQILLRILMKVGLNIIIFAWTKARKRYPRVYLFSKGPFSTKIFDSFEFLKIWTCNAKVMAKDKQSISQLPSPYTPWNDKTTNTYSCGLSGACLVSSYRIQKEMRRRERRKEIPSW